MAASVLVHNGCTTAIEAHLAGRPIINYSVRSAVRDSVRTPNLLGTSCTSEDQVIATIKAIQAGSDHSRVHALEPLDRELFHNFSEESLSSVVRVVGEAQETNTAKPETPSVARMRLMEARRLVKDGVKLPIRRLIPAKQNTYRAVRRMFYGFARETVRNKVESIQRLRDKRIRLTHISDSLLVVDAVDD